MKALGLILVSILGQASFAATVISYGPFSGEPVAIERTSLDSVNGVLTVVAQTKTECRIPREVANSAGIRLRELSKKIQLGLPLHLDCRGEDVSGREVLASEISVRFGRPVLEVNAQVP